MKHDPEVSQLLKKENPDGGCRQWLQEFGVSSAMLSAIARVAHPDLYWAGRNAFLALQEIEEINEVMTMWNSVFNGVSIIVDRESPLHRDVGTRAAWYDILATIGGDVDTSMRWPGLGISVSYRSGTVVLFSGFTIPHCVEMSEMDRVCFAYYMKESVHARTSVLSPSWMTIKQHNV
jgi:hypothetical protein